MRHTLDSRTVRVDQKDMDAEIQRLRKEGWEITRTSTTDDKQVEMAISRWVAAATDPLASPVAPQTEMERIRQERAMQEEVLRREQESQR